MKKVLSVKKRLSLSPVVLIGAFMGLPSLSYAQTRHHEAHSHGTAQVAIAFEKSEGTIEFDGASEGVLGFEHQPQSKKDKETLEKVIRAFESEIGKMIVFDPSLGCQFSKTKIGMEFEKEKVPSPKNESKSKKHHHGQHSDFKAEFKVSCQKSPLGTDLILDFSNFDRLQVVQVSVIADQIQKGSEYKKGRAVKVSLKP